MKFPESIVAPEISVHAVSPECDCSVVCSMNVCGISAPCASGKKNPNAIAKGMIKKKGYCVTSTDPTDVCM